jgi:hypothetical protein
MMTTNLTLGRGFRLPFEDRRFYFSPDEFRGYFPERVVNHMAEGAQSSYPGLLPVPEPARLPVVVATRLSLSFPIVMSMVPLYAIDFSSRSTDTAPADEPGDDVLNQPARGRVPEVNWFSDGGIVSNFPVHFFDRTLPRWPTFNINLRSFAEGEQPSDVESRNVYFPVTNRGGILEDWTRFNSVRGFLLALKSTMQNWLDNAQSRQPGFRDRIVHIGLSTDEGGLNLKMPKPVLGRLSERGRIAGVFLRNRFAHPPSNRNDLSWDSHRWVRYRTGMATLERLLLDLRRGFLDTQQGDRTYEQLITRSPSDMPASYQWTNDLQRQFALQTTEALLDAVRAWQEQEERFAKGAPRPDPDLRIVPRI